MNITEQKAERWLRAQGITSIFQPRKSPDFICQDGSGYEVKLLRQNSITFSSSQFETLCNFPGELTVLVFNGGEEPLHKIQFNEIDRQRPYWRNLQIIVYVTDDGTNIRGLDPQLYRLARAEAIGQGKFIGQWLNEVIKEKLNKKGGKSQ